MRKDGEGKFFSLQNIPNSKKVVCDQWKHCETSITKLLLYQLLEINIPNSKKVLCDQWKHRESSMSIASAISTI